MATFSSRVDALISYLRGYPAPLQYSYGTAGFRGAAHTLHAATARMAVVATLRSWATHGDKQKLLHSHVHGHLHTHGVSSPSHAQSSSAASSDAACPVVGLMITASHNEHGDNGLKCVDPSGEMIAQAWEQLCTSIANCPFDKLKAELDSIVQQFNIDTTLTPRIFIGRDTRASSPELASIAASAAKLLGAQVTEWGICTTPQLHWLVKEFNQGRTATMEAYYQQLSNAFKTALACRAAPPPIHTLPFLSPLIVDCANGVGSHALRDMSKHIQQIHMEIRNDNTEWKEGLNHQCGAEYVQKSRALPLNFDAEADRGKRLASVDGDADRLVYFYINNTGDVRLMDGDKIIALYTLFISDLLNKAELNSSLSIGIVQTAYANGASSLYMTNQLNIPVQFTNTGVKYLHHKAVEYDIGIYFEANGHGTVVFSNHAQQIIHQAAHNTQQAPAKHDAARCLQALVEMVNQCVGDAISDLLLVEVALYHRDWHLHDWDAVYEDLPSSMLKVKVKDRNVITTTDAERVCVTPAGLQDAIDKLVNNGPGGVRGVRRSFVRPSGTEDIVRVYAEASTRAEVDELANQVCKAVFELAGGIQ